LFKEEASHMSSPTNRMGPKIWLIVAAAIAVVVVVILLVLYGSGGSGGSGGTGGY